MVDWISHLLLLAYLVPAALLTLYALNLYTLVWLFLRKRGQHTARPRPELPTDLPAVVTQVPVYNEINVIERCLRAVAAMRWAGEHHIQVLDDSTDETQTLIDRLVTELSSAGVRIEVLRRSDRVGYKAGALDAAMPHTQADYICMFDADFVPPADFLERSMAVMLAEPQAGIVQARWGHLNRDDSILTQAQAIGIDGHFSVEQPARAWNGLFMNFNGTAGLWRRDAIEAAGGWEHDTLTEDMDLSYRAQLAGWQPHFVWDLEAPAELPADINAFKSQQFRWAKGSMETAIKLLPRVFRSPDFGPLAKIQAVFHMTHYLVHPIMLWMALLFFPVARYTLLHRHPLPFAILVGLILVSTLAPSVLYSVSQHSLGAGRLSRLRFIPILSLMGIGIAVSNTRAIAEALLRRKSGFVRTPKKGEGEIKRYAIRMPVLALLELAVGAYCVLSLWFFLQQANHFVLPFVLLYAAGFSFVGLLSLWPKRAAKLLPAEAGTCQTAES